MCASVQASWRPEVAEGALEFPLGAYERGCPLAASNGASTVQQLGGMVCLGVWPLRSTVGHVDQQLKRLLVRTPSPQMVTHLAGRCDLEHI